ncbi:LysM peptidoglycan-binding domain-containing protein [Leifsonia lichenia]
MNVRGRRGRGPAAIVVAAVAVVVLLAGCAEPAPTHHPRSVAPAGAAESTAAPTPSAVPLAEQFEYLPAAGTQLASGTLSGQLDRASGDVTVVVGQKLDIEVRLDGFETSGLTYLNAALSTDRFGMLAGAPSVPAPDLALGQVPETSGDFTFTVDPASRDDKGDLSYFNAFELVRADGTVSSAAVLTWTVPDFFPGLVVTDSGPIRFARGTVTTYQGAPAGYTANPLDTVDAISRRFGITPLQLVYLNPQLGYRNTRLVEGQRLNLSPTYRSNR